MIDLLTWAFLLYFGSLNLGYLLLNLIGADAFIRDIVNL